MRRLLGLLAVVLVVCAGCTKGSDDRTEPTVPNPSATQSSTTLASLGLDWPNSLDPGKPPATPTGFTDAMLLDMAKSLEAWAGLTSVDSDLWHARRPVEAVAAVLPASAGKTFTKQVKAAVSPRLAVANVFADNVTVGRREVTTAWKVSTAKDDDGKPFVLLELQTRTAYEVRKGNGAIRVIGVLRVHGLSAYADTTDDYGVSGGWQEFGAGDCALALDDDLVPDSDGAEAAKDLETFVKIGNRAKLVMPPLDVEEQVDADYLKRCREGSI